MRVLCFFYILNSWQIKKKTTIENQGVAKNNNYELSKSTYFDFSSF